MPAENTEHNEVPVRRPRRRWARGSDRPENLRPGDVDQLMMMIVALMSEVSALRDRIDTHEALVERGETPTCAAIEAFELSPERRATREERRQAMLSRVLRVILEEREAELDNFK